MQLFQRNISITQDGLIFNNNNSDRKKNKKKQCFYSIRIK